MKNKEEMTFDEFVENADYDSARVGKPEVVEVLPPVVPEVSSPTGMSVIDGHISLAIQHGNIDSLERLLKLRREEEALWAHKQYNTAMAAFQLECPPVYRMKAGGREKATGKVIYQYAPLEDLIGHTKEYRAKHGFFFMFSCRVENELVIATCTVVHKDGHERSTEHPAPPGYGTGAQDTKQTYAGAFTFASRYAFKSAFGLSVIGEDDEERITNFHEKLTMSGPPTPAEMSTLLSLIDEAGYPVQAVANRFKVASITDMDRQTCLHATKLIREYLAKEKKAVKQTTEEVIPGLND